MALMTFGAGLSAVALWLSWTQLGLFTRLFNGELIPDETMVASDDRIALVAMAEIALGIVAAFAFILWAHRARVALDRLGQQGLKYSTRWAWAGFVIPIMNVFRPYQVMSEIWRASEVPSLDATEWTRRATPMLIQVWWSFALFHGLVSRVFVQQSRRLVTPDDFINFARTSVAVDALGIVTAVLAYLVVREIDRRQSIRFASAPVPAMEPLPAAM
jgi:hypothetical protein